MLVSGEAPLWQRQGSSETVTTAPPETERDASGWERCFDTASGDVWWHRNGESTWEEPPLPEPQPPLPPQQQNLTSSVAAWASGLLHSLSGAGLPPPLPAPAPTPGLAAHGEEWVRVVAANGTVSFRNSATGEVTERPPAHFLSQAGARKLGARENALRSTTAMGQALALFRINGRAMTEMQAALIVQRAVRRRQLARQTALWARVARFEQGSSARGAQAKTRG